jgi:hypothetical protein
VTRRYRWRCPYCSAGGVEAGPGAARDAGLAHWETYHARTLDELGPDA